VAVVFAGNARSSRARIEVVRGARPGQHSLATQVSERK
jgi:hypothetical protein